MNNYPYEIEDLEGLSNEELRDFSKVLDKIHDSCVTQNEYY
jgi:hypothetical protein